MVIVDVKCNQWGISKWTKVYAKVLKLTSPKSKQSWDVYAKVLKLTLHKSKQSWEVWIQTNFTRENYK